MRDKDTFVGRAKNGYFVLLEEGKSTWEFVAK